MIETFAPDFSIHDINCLCQRYLAALYPAAPLKPLDHRSTDVMLTYGEILYESIRKLIGKMDLGTDDIFVDLGSGTGKIPIQVFLTTGAKEAIGIEIMPGLHQYAAGAEEKLRHEVPGFFVGQRKLTFIQGNFLTFPWKGTVVFINSICYSQAFLGKLGRVINQIPGLRLVLTLRPIPTLEHFSFKKTQRLECTWDSALCYFYERKRST